MSRLTSPAMPPTNSSTFQPFVPGCHSTEPLRPFTYGWKRLARTSGMQQHTERRSAKAGSKLTVTTLAFLEQPPPASLIRRRVPLQRSLIMKRQALLQESILEKAPSQTSVDGTSTPDRLLVVLLREASSSCQLQCLQLQVVHHFPKLCSTLLTSCLVLGCYQFRML